MEFSSFLSGQFTTVAIVSQPDRKLVNPTSLQWSEFNLSLNHQPEWTLMKSFPNRDLSQKYAHIILYGQVYLKVAILP